MMAWIATTTRRHRSQISPTQINRLITSPSPICSSTGNGHTRFRLAFHRARKSRTTLQNKVRLKVLPEQLTLFVNTSVTLKKCIIQ